MASSDTTASAPISNACALEAVLVSILLVSVLGTWVPCILDAALLSLPLLEAAVSVAAEGAVLPVSPDGDVPKCSLHMDSLPWILRLRSWLAVLTQANSKNCSSCRPLALENLLQHRPKLQDSLHVAMLLTRRWSLPQEHRQPIVSRSTQGYCICPSNCTINIYIHISECLASRDV